MLRFWVVMLGLAALSVAADSYTAELDREKPIAQYKLQSECVDGHCRRVRGCIAITSQRAYIKLDSSIYSFKVTYYDREERIAAIGGHGVTGILRQQGNTLQFFVTPNDKHRFKPTTVYYIYSHAATY